MAAHSRHAVALVEFTNVPASQASHRQHELQTSRARGEGNKSQRQERGGTQFEAASLPAGELVPTEQLENLPCGHLMHAVALPTALYVPAERRPSEQLPQGSKAEPEGQGCSLLSSAIRVREMMGKASYLRGSLHRMHSTPTWPRVSRTVPRHRVSPSMKRLPLHSSMCLSRTQPPTSTRIVSTGMPVQILERQKRGGQAQRLSTRASNKQSPRRRQHESATVKRWPGIRIVRLATLGSHPTVRHIFG